MLTLPERDVDVDQRGGVAVDDDPVVTAACVDLEPVGSFNEGDDVVLWAGVSPLDYPTITITEEVADGNPASSGRRVLVGLVDG